MAHEVLTKWDAGEIVHTIEMGGIGPGYEQALQMAAIEALRCLEDYAEAGNEIEEKDEVLRPIMEPGLSRITGLSGAQAGAAMWLGFQWFKHGEQGLIDEAKRQGVDENRLILVSNNWPSICEG